MGRKPSPEDAPRGLTHNPFAELRPDGAPAHPTPAHPAQEAAAGPAGGRLVVRREKRGRGGKTVTRIAGLALDERALEALARDMKRALGCGASVGGGELLLQGAQTGRVAAWLRERLGADVVVGN